MKKAVLFLLLCSAALLSCRKADSNIANRTALPGTWTLAALLTDPGNGSGTWKPAFSDTLQLTFTPDGGIAGTAFPEARHYEITSNTNIRFTFADGTFINYNYTLENTTLVLSGGGCIETCGLKFQKNNTLSQ